MGRKLNPEATSREDFIEYLEKGSADLSLELRTLQLLTAQGLKCEHGGLYRDPLTSKDRQFDIRAIARANGRCVRLAIECKNAGANFPLLVSRVPRHESESFHEIALVGEVADGPHVHGLYEERGHIVRIHDPISLYRASEPVGKSLAQVGRQGEKLVETDEDIFDKWSQSLGSAADLVSASYWEGSDDHPSLSAVAVIPIVVLPDGRLWTVDFNSHGARISDPQQTDRCSLFVNRQYAMTEGGPTLRLSHVEFLTLSRLSMFVRDFLQDDLAMQAIFPGERIKAVLTDLNDGRWYV